MRASDTFSNCCERSNPPCASIVRTRVGQCVAEGQAVQGFIEGDSIPDIFIPGMIDLHVQGRFPFDKLVRFYPFNEINRAVDDQLKGIAIKPILEVSAA
jgi:aryl-alcohol dehydrogenase